MKLLKSNQLRATKRSAGFSLAEAAVGMGVVGIVFVSLYSGLTSGIGTISMSRENARATQIMAEKLDAIRLYSWDKILVNTNTTFTATFAPGGSPTNSSAGVTYSGTVTVTPAPVDNSYNNLMRQITVSLSWETGSLKRSRSMTTLVAKHGMQNYIY